MGQKVNPYGFRVGIYADWNGKWYARKLDYAKVVKRDLAIRKIVKRVLADAAVEDVSVLRPAPGLVEVVIRTARPGVVIGKKGEMIKGVTEKINAALKGDEKATLRVYEIPEPDLSARIIAENIASQILKKVHYRRAMKRAIELALEKGAQGIRIECKGRLAGAEIARKDWYQRGRVPRQTLRAIVDYGFAKCLTKYGYIGIKVWTYRGELLGNKWYSALKEEAESASATA
ncbi:MAG: 30S ribosomal protein S3 [bacterium]